MLLDFLICSALFAWLVINTQSGIILTAHYTQDISIIISLILTFPKIYMQSLNCVAIIHFGALDLKAIHRAHTELLNILPGAGQHLIPKLIIDSGKVALLTYFRRIYGL